VKKFPSLKRGGGGIYITFRNPPKSPFSKGGLKTGGATFFPVEKGPAALKEVLK
jgi:hypothetical protein